MLYRMSWSLLISVVVSTFASEQVVAGESGSVSSIALNETQEKIEQVIDKYVSNRAFEGAILVSKFGQIIFQRGYGFSDRTLQKPTKPETSFLLASLSKPVTATLVMQLVEQGKLALDDTLAKYLPQFDNAKGKQITLHHLLSNTSGIPNHFVIPGWSKSDFQKNTSDLEFIKLIGQQPLSFTPGTDYLYSNPGYFLLGKIIERVTNNSFSDNLKKYIFTPLNMNESGVAHGTTINPNIAKGYRWQERGSYRQQIPMNMTLFGAGAAIFSSVEDIFKFDLALYDNKLLTDKSKKLTFDPQEPYGWNLGTVPLTENQIVNIHTYNGQIKGYSSMLTRFIEDKHSIILMSNVGVSYAIKQQLTFDIASVLYGQEPPNRSKDMTLKLINSIVVGRFEEELKKIKSKTHNLDLSEESITELAFQLLWSGLSDKSLELFSFLSLQFTGPFSQARNNLLRACNHGQAKNSEIKARICS